jgi:hypothetical protein
MTKDEALDKALDKALEALEESVDLVREDYENAKKLYGNYPSRQARLLGMEDGLLKHEAAITAIKQALAAPTVQEPIGYLFQHEETGLTTVVDVQQVEWGFEKNNPRHQKIGPVYTTPPEKPAPVQEPVAWEAGFSVHDGVITGGASDLERFRALTRNAALDEIAAKIEAMPFGDTAASFAVWIKEQKT